MDMYKRIGIVCRAIPQGRVATYGQIALLCGSPGHARQVGYALGHGRAGEVPAYRVVNARGRLSGAASFETWDMQKLLLEADGILVRREPDGWYVDLNRYGWKNTMEDARRLQKEFQEEERQGMSGVQVPE